MQVVFKPGSSNLKACGPCLAMHDCFIEGPSCYAWLVAEVRHPQSLKYDRITEKQGSRWDILLASDSLANLRQVGVHGPIIEGKAGIAIASKKGHGVA